MDEIKLQRKILVVAQYKENVEWTKHPALDDYVKSIIKKEVDIPNIGREPHTFLWQTLRLYRSIRPDDEIAYVQGNPFDHCPDLIERLQTPIQKNYEPLGKSIFESMGDGSPHHRGLPVKEYYEKHFKKPFPEKVSFTPGGQFRIKGEALLSRPYSFYEHLFEDCAEYQHPWVLERLWGSIFERRG